MTTLDKPIALGLVGAPGSGKTKVAEAFAALVEEHNLLDTPLTILENPTKEMEDYGLALGLEATYDVNWLLTAKQMEQEIALRTSKDGPQSFVTLGTLIERLAHAGLRVEQLGTGLETPQTKDLLMREMHATTLISLLMVDTFHYSAVFYLPLPDQIEIPGQTQDNTNKRIDHAIRLAMERFRIPVVGLNGDAQTQAQTMFDIIKQSAEQQPTEEGEVDDTGTDVPAEAAAGEGDGTAVSSPEHRGTESSDDLHGGADTPA